MAATLGEEEKDHYGQQSPRGGKEEAGLGHFSPVVMSGCAGPAWKVLEAFEAFNLAFLTISARLAWSFCSLQLIPSHVTQQHIRGTRLQRRELPLESSGK